VIVCAACKDGVPPFNKSFSKGLRVSDNLLRISAEGRLERFAKGHGLGGDDVHVRATLHPREEGPIQQRTHFFEFAARGPLPKGILKVLPHQKDPSSGTSQGLMGGAGDHMTVRQGIVQKAGCNQASGMGYIRYEEGAYFVSDFPKGLPVPIPRIAAGSRQEDFRAKAAGFVSDLVVIKPVGVWPYAVMLDGVEFTGGVERAAMGKVAAMRQLKAQKLFSGFEQGQKHGFVGLGTRMRLDIGPDRSKKGLHPLLGQLFHLIYVLTPSIVPPPWEALSVLVGEDRTQSSKHRRTGVIFRSDEFKALFLPAALRFYPAENGILHITKIGPYAWPKLRCPVHIPGFQ